MAGSRTDQIRESEVIQESFMSLWLVRAGSSGEQQEACLENNFVTIGWNELPDLSKVSNREELKSIYQETYPSEKSGAVSNRGGQIYTFCSKIEVGDIVALPIKGEPLIAFGEVTGAYQFTTQFGDNIRHILPVRWINKEVQRVSFDQDLLYSFGAFMTVCRIQRNNAEERVRAILSGKRQRYTENVDTEESEESFETHDFSEVARDQILRFISQKFKGHKLEDLVEAVLQAQGYHTNKTSPGPDQGADILAGSGHLGFESPRILVEVKSGNELVGSDVIDRMMGALDRFSADYGLCISFNGFKSGVKKLNRTAFFKVRDCNFLCVTA